VLLGFITLGFSLIALMFYPQMAQRKRSIEEATLTFGIPPVCVFTKVVLPNFRTAFISSVVTMFVYFLGVFVMPTMLGHPQDWNMTVIITDKAVGDANADDPRSPEARSHFRQIGRSALRSGR
jgi:putative spermidine/putrescine transport system permease protein